MLGVLPGTIGTLQATEAIKVLLGIGEPLIGKLLLYNALDMSFDFVRLKKNPNCRVCGPNADIKEVNVTENPAGDYYGWKDKNGEIEFIWPSEAQRDMCFPYGPKVEEDKGTGVRVRLSVTQKEPQ